jgi:Tfp pilus assembly protein PilF/peroxiredoxin
VTVETDVFKKTKVVNAGSGFLSQHSKELLFGLGGSRQIRHLAVEWPSGARQDFTNVALNQRLRIEEGGEPRAETLAAPRLAAPNERAAAPERARAPRASWIREPFPTFDFTLPDFAGTTRSLSALRGRPALVLLWASKAAGSRDALQELARGRAALGRAGVGLLAVSLDGPDELARAKGTAAGIPGVPVVAASEDLAKSFAILYRHLFMNRQPLPLPTALLLDAEGGVVRVYRERLAAEDVAADAAKIDAAPAEQLARAAPFEGTFLSDLGARNYVPYGQELLDQGLEAAAIVAFERAARSDPNASTLYRLGTLFAKSGQSAKAKAAFERALAKQPDLAEASNDLGALLAQGGDVAAAITRFRAALRAAPDYPDALNNLGYALLQRGDAQEARSLYEKALKLQPDFPEAMNNLGLILGREGALDRAEPYFKGALEKRPDYGEAANNLAVVLVSRGRASEAVKLLTGFLEKNPAFENTYLTLAKIYLTTGQKREGVAILERLLQRNPTHALGIELLRQARLP